MQHNILQTFFSNVEVYIKIQQIYKSNQLYAQNSYISNKLKKAVSEYQAVLNYEAYDLEESPNEIMDAALSGVFFTRRIKKLSRPDGFMFYGKPGIDIFCTSALLCPDTKVRLRLIRGRSTFYLTTDNHYVSLGNVDCSLYTCRFALKDNRHRKKWTSFHIFL